MLGQPVVGHAETTAGEQVSLVAVVSKRSRFANQPVDDVAVVDSVLASPTQSRHFLHPLAAVPKFDPLGVQVGLDPLADQPAGHRVDVALDADSAARFHPHPQLLECLQPALRQCSKHRHFFGQPGPTPGVELAEQLLQESGVGISV